MTKNIPPFSFCRQALLWRASVNRLRACGLIGGALFGLTPLAPSVLAADSYTYTGTTGTATAPSTSATFTGAFTDTTSSTANTTPVSPAATLTFGGSNTYSATDDIASLTLSGGLSFTNTGTVTINASNGATIYGSGSTLGFSLSTGAVTFNPAINEGTATLTFSGTSSNSTNSTINSIISGSGGLTDNFQTTNGASGGSIQLYGTNTYSGVTDIKAGASLILDNQSGLGSSSVTVETNGELDFNIGANGTVANNITINGTGVGGAGAIRGVSTTTLSGTVTLGSNSLIYNNNASFGISISGGVNLATYTLTDNQSGATSVSGAISGTGGSFTDVGTGMLTLSGALSYTGTTTVNAGILAITTGGGTTAAPLGNVYVANAGSPATLNVSANLEFGNNIINVGNGTAAGVMNQTGGTINTSADSGSLQLGYNGTTGTGTYGSYNISGGTLNIATIRTGNSAGGTFFNVQTGGTVAATGNALINRNGGYNVLYVNGGTFSADTSKNASLNLNLDYANTGTGVLTLAAGVINTNSQMVVGGSGGTVIVNLNGGTLNTGGLITGSGGSTSVLNFNGGTLQGNASTVAPANFFATTAAGTTAGTLTNANVYAGGAKIDTNGLNITIGQALLSTTGTTGITSIPLASGGAGAGYLSAPVVSISGGSGTGATAIANISGGTISSITITSPGTGYTSVPTISLIGGGPTTAATLGTSAIGMDTTTDGGLTVSSSTGSGTLTLSGASTYVGPTTVTSGSLSTTLAKATPGGTGGTLVNTSGIVVNGTGTLLLSANNSVNSAAGVSLASTSGTTGLSVANTVLQGKGATVAAGTVTGGTPTTAGLSALTLTANATLSFTGSSGTVVFNSFTDSGSYKLNVTGSNFASVMVGNSSDGTTDRLIIEGDQSANLADFTFNGVADAGEIALDNGFYEICPVPEPATWGAGALMLGAAGFSLRRRLRGLLAA